MRLYGPGVKCYRGTIGWLFIIKLEGNVFRDWFGKKNVPLSGAPAVRRMKTYSAQSGYVYQYVYSGQRPLARSAGVEFVFSVSADRKNWHEVGVLVEGPSVREWERSHQRNLSATEWYALAKMALFAAFDERETPAGMRGEPVRLRAADVAEIMERLDRD
jgi:hypothetical protein